MVQVLALQVQLTAVLLAHTLGVIQWTGATNVVFQQGMVFCLKLFTLNDGQVSLLQVVYTLVEYLGNIRPAKLSVKTSLVSKIIFHIFFNV